MLAVISRLATVSMLAVISILTVKRSLIFACLMTLPYLASADIYVVVSTKNTISELSKKDIIALYTGRTKAFPDGELAKVLDYSDDQEIKADFYKILTNRSLAQISSYWARLSFTGRHTPPPQKESMLDVVAAIADNPQAIGYVSSMPEGSEDTIKTVFTIELP